MPGPHLYQRKESEVWWWHARVDGKLVRRTTGQRDRAAALEAAAGAWLSECQRARVAVPAGTRVRLSQLVAVHLGDLRDRLQRGELTRGPRYYSDQEGALRRLALRWQDASEIGPGWERALADWHAEGASWRRLQVVADAARKFVRWAAEAGHLPAAPALRAPSAEDVTVEARERRPFSAGERDRFLAAVAKDDARAARIYTVLFWSACRKSDLERLTWRQVDLREGWLRFPPRQTKSRKRDQVVALHPRAAKALRAELAAQGKVVDPAAPVFGRFSFRARFAGWCAAAGIRDMEGLVPHHVARHTTATLAGDAGATLAELMALGRWVTPQMAARYMRVNARASKRALDRL